jgi:hypothetical protein
MLQESERVGMEKRVYLLNKEQIDHFWPDILRLLGEVPMYYDFFTPEWTYSKAKAGDLQIWGLSDEKIRGIVVTQILVFPAQKAFEILGAAGNGLLEFFDQMDDVFEFIAADCECQTIIMRCRPGIERKILRQGRGIKGCSFLYRPVGKRSEH